MLLKENDGLKFCGKNVDKMMFHVNDWTEYIIVM